MAYRNKTYVCFDGDNDMAYYRTMQMWNENENFPFSFYDAHDLNSARDSSQEESIKRQLRERFANSNLFVVLIGDSTRYLTKFVKWEMEVAIKLDLPIIAVNLNGSKVIDASLCPPTIKNELSIHIPFKMSIMQYAMENWPSSHALHRKNGVNEPRYYIESVYNSLEQKKA